jgi:hypothetical protein
MLPAGRFRAAAAVNVPSVPCFPALYAQGALSLGKAAELAEVNRVLFGEMVGQRGIARHYGDAELAQDVSYPRSEQYRAGRLTGRSEPSTGLRFFCRGIMAC